jgi:glycosyltransferase involved in cell wall biosynthesis/GT2 family glycosyltransferase
MTRTSVSVVINTLDRAAHLRTALRALEQLRYPAFEVIVVNGPSRDDTEAVLDGYGDRIKRARCPEANLSMSRNIGIGLAAGDVVAFLDDDAIPEPDWLDELVRGYEDPGVGAVGGFLRDHTGVTFQCRVTVCDRFGDSEGFDTVEAAGVTNKPGDWRFLSPTGANSSFRRSALLAVGGFDETFAYFLDETDVNLRILDAGWTIAYQPAAEVHHKYAPSALRDHRKVPSTLYMPARSKAYFMARHGQGAPEGGSRALARVTTSMRRDVERHLGAGQVSEADADRLKAEIDRGSQDGRLRGPAAPLTHTDWKEPPAFLAFPLRRPPALRLRIALACQSWSTGGGIAVWMRALARGLAEGGHEVTVIDRASDGRATVDFENGIWIHRVPDRAPATFAGRTPFEMPAHAAARAWAVNDEVARVRVVRGLDVVLAPIWDLEGAAMLTREAGPLVVTTLHTTYGLARPYKPDWREASMPQQMEGAEARILAEAPHLLANSHALLDALDDWRPGLDLETRATVIPHAVDDVARPERRSEDGRVRALFVGRLESRKGAPELLQAMAIALEAEPNLEVDIVGEPVSEAGEPIGATFLAAHSEAGWLDRLHFRGRLDDTQTQALRARADIVLAPSRFESFGLVYIEALMAGAALIAADAGSAREILGHDGDAAVLVPAGDAPALAEALVELARDPDRRRRLSAHGRARYLERYTSPVMIQAIETYLKGLVQARSRLWRSALQPL